MQVSLPPPLVPASLPTTMNHVQQSGSSSTTNGIGNGQPARTLRTSSRSIKPVRPASEVVTPSKSKPNHIAFSPAAVGAGASTVSGVSPKQSPTTEHHHHRRKPTFTTSLSYPEYLPAPSHFQAEGELQRNQRRSKVEALTKIDRAGTPIQLNAGPAATSFLPSSAQGAHLNGSSSAAIANGGGNGNGATAGPSVSRNPLHRPVALNPPFALSTVRTEAPRHPPRRSSPRLFGLEECPTFYPTMEEFQDPMGYVDSIAEIGRQYGICKVVPPEGWQMPFAIETETFRFKSRLQRLNQLEAASRAKVNFLEQLSMYHLQQGDSDVSIPLIDRQPLDLWKLRKEVNKLGGHLVLDRTKTWADVTVTLGHKAAWHPQVRDAYMKIVLPFDKWAVRAKSASVSPLTPLNMTTSNGKPAPPPAFATSAPPSPSQPRTSGRMGAVKTSPRTRMNGAVAAAAPGILPLKTAEPSLNSASSLPPSGSSRLDAPAEIVRPNSAAPSLPSLKIKVPGFSNRDGSESELSDEDSSLSDGSPRRPAKVQTPEYQKGEVCEVCRGGHAGDKILLCDGCDRGFHIYCLDPPLASVPTNEEWFCTSCLLSQGDDFGFEEGEDHSISSFQARDAAFSHAWWNRHRPPPSPGSSSAPGINRNPLARNFGKAVVTEDDVEREFWRLTESSTDTVEVEYGADIHSTTHGSAGPTSETHPLDPYATDPWNLNNMPILPNSLLRYIKSDISGMTVPWIYIGMMFSTFCWHNEDHYTYSINYMYWGETKTWYGIPGGDAEKFEEAMKSEAPELFEQQPGLLFQLVTMMNPGRISEAGVKVVACDQRPNEFVITFPKAYHCGFNHGINMNEAVNFALPDWLAEGKQSVRKYREHLKAPVFSHNELLITVTLYSETIKTALWIKDSLIEMVEEEKQRREKLRARYPSLHETLVEDDSPEEQYQCATCKAFCYLAQVTCPCTKLVTCLEHADQLCECSKSKKMLRKRYSEAQLEEILEAVVARAKQPARWRENFYRVMEAPRPTLKSMRGLLADAEKVAYPIEEVQSLRAFVERANAWIERASAVTTRKTTGRRRKGGKEKDEDEDMVDRSPEVLTALVKEGERMSFDAPETLQPLRQMLLSINTFRSQASDILSTPEEELDLEKCRQVMILGESLNFDLPEIQAIATIVNRLDWFKKVEEEVDDRMLQYDDTVELLEQAVEYEIPAEHPTIIELIRRRDKGKDWLDSADKLLTAPVIQLDDISALIEEREPTTPVSVDVVRQMENLRKTVQNWQTSARTILASNGSTVAAQRLCKNVQSASAPINRVEIPEIVELQAELDHHAKWLSEAAKVLDNSSSNVANLINYIKGEFDQHLKPDDLEPTAVCFCRRPPRQSMVTCRNCQGAYHAKCVDVPPKKVNEPFQCALCIRIPNDDGPSLSDFANLVQPFRWNFVITPPEFTIAQSIVEAASNIGPDLIKVADPKNQAEPCRDVEKIRSLLRKIYTLPLVFDMINTDTNERCVLIEWLFRRLQDAIKFKEGLPGSGSGIQEKTATTERTRTRGKKARLIIAQARPRQFWCICQEAGSEPPLDKLITVECAKCGQNYHSSCVKAPLEVSGTTEGKVGWRCPCCCVKEAKRYLKGIDVRVQMKEQFGTDEYIDYRSTINDYAEQPVIVTYPPSTEVILLECTSFIPPVLPEEIGTGEGVGGDEGGPKKKRKIRASDVGSVVNGHGHSEYSTPKLKHELAPVATSGGDSSVNNNYAYPSPSPSSQIRPVDSWRKPTVNGSHPPASSSMGITPPISRTIFDAAARTNGTSARTTHPFAPTTISPYAAVSVYRPTTARAFDASPQTPGAVSHSATSTPYIRPPPPHVLPEVSQPSAPSPTIAPPPVDKTPINGTMTNGQSGHFSLSIGSVKRKPDDERSSPSEIIVATNGDHTSKQSPTFAIEPNGVDSRPSPTVSGGERKMIKVTNAIDLSRSSPPKEEEGEARERVGSSPEKPIVID
ncbi:hypothetical protein CI109_106548 [Kwoniella shandongensis]|uniref:[histone H3]-trimethyl-L-lysine(4) demethylase n=1 Tax=Kwoniella shandongensis TaxID=1734106 RepID=A0A5M6C2N5_9TREE|nr:uncharacterized protein CI109_002728 [Kwoniella shandongensis]KAA5528971.1 hypothetical protein CI109_002728 [Kwoniella shandongensis]